MLIFVEAGIAGTGLSCLRWAEDAGLDPALVTSDPSVYRDVPDGSLLELLVSRDRVFNAKDTDGDELDPGLLDWARSGDSTIGVVCVGDRNLPFAATLAEALGAPFPSVEAVATFRDKRAARHVYTELGIRSPRWAPAADAEEAVALFERVGPVVLKNVKGAGSLDVLLCRTAEEVRAHHHALATGGRYLDGELMAEEFVTGPLLSVETVVTDQRCVHLGVTDRQLGPRPHFCEVSYTFPVLAPPAARAEMERAVEACVRHFGLTGFLHSEFILTADGPVLVEINARLGGGLLAPMMTDCLTVSSWELLCRAALGQPVPVPEHTGRYASVVTVYPQAAGTVESLVEPGVVAANPFVVDVVWNAGPGDRVAPATDYRGSLCQIRTVADAPAVAYNAALTAARDVRVNLVAAGRRRG
ncbi:ATP-grasp domain-containing protein [Longispora sp. NPDC051575]|uniref:ATP-grasp domain-containing protein n=1 Tax=Longispora sp. NPDC051575 TaxID=3154943 RepID=UPI00342F8927